MKPSAYVCPSCPTTGEWHFEHADTVRMVPMFDRAAMVRLVVAQQWATAITALLSWGHLTYVASPTTPPQSDDSHRSLHWSLVGGHVPAEIWPGITPCAVDVVADLLGAP